MQSSSIAALAPALLKAQMLMGAAKKDAKNPFFKSKYADLGAVMEVCKSALNENGLAALQPVSNGCVITRLVHESGEWIEDGGVAIVCAKQNDPQAQGAAISYARRYGLASFLFIPAEDDDAEGAMQRKPELAKKDAPVATSGLATPAQLEELGALSKEKNITPETIEKWCAGQGVKRVEQLSEKYVAGLITWLKTPHNKGEKK